ncbi:MAG: hypothetical protein C4560_12655, partial [Nitrospiraceae bacterium]
MFSRFAKPVIFIDVLLVCLFVALLPCGLCEDSAVALAWDPPTTNSDGSPLTDLAGYKVYIGAGPGEYFQDIDVGDITSYTVSGLAVPYYFAVTAYDTSGNESGYSDEVSTVVAVPASDDFNSGVLDEDLWSFVNPRGDASVTMTGSQAAISVPAGVSHDVWYGGNYAPRIMQAVSNVDFEIEVKFDSGVSR